MKSKRLSSRVLLEVLTAHFAGDADEAVRFLRAFASADLLMPTQPEIEQLIAADRAARRLDRTSAPCEISRAATHFGVSRGRVVDRAAKIVPRAVRSPGGEN